VNERDEVVAEEGDTVELAGGFHQLIDGEVVGGVITGVPCPDGEAFPVQHPIEQRTDLPISRLGVLYWGSGGRRPLAAGNRYAPRAGKALGRTRPFAHVVIGAH
jgi:hypothetical protein